MPRHREQILADLSVSDATWTTVNAAARSAALAGHRDEADTYLDTADQVHQQRADLLDQLAALDADAAIDASDHVIHDTEQELIRTVREADPAGSRDLTDTQILDMVTTMLGGKDAVDAAADPAADAEASRLATSRRDNAADDAHGPTTTEHNWDDGWDDGDDYAAGYGA